MLVEERRGAHETLMGRLASILYAIHQRIP